MAKDGSAQEEQMEGQTIDAFPEGINLSELEARYQPIVGFTDWMGGEIFDEEGIADRVKEMELLGNNEALDAATRVATRAAAVESGAIEGLYETDVGLTMSIAIQEADWQARARASDERIPDFFEAQLKAYDLASEVASNREPVTQKWIRELHAVLTEPQATYPVLTAAGWTERPLGKGVYKDLPTVVKQDDNTFHAYAPIEQTQPEMQRLVDEIGATAFDRAHAVLKAAYVHHALTNIHPFADGNGRVARALASMFLRTGVRAPFLVWNSERIAYLGALRAADEGRRQTFVTFVSKRVVDAQQMILAHLTPGPSDQAVKLRELHLSSGGLTHTELDRIASGLRDAITPIIQTLIAEASLPAGVRANTDAGSTSVFKDEENYRLPKKGTSHVRLTLESGWPAAANTTVNYQVLIARSDSNEYAFKIDSTSEAKRTRHLDVRLEQVHPSHSPTFVAILRMWLESTISTALDVLASKGRASFEKSGL